ncbi:acyl-CoA dehydrogenase family protein [Lentzea aerocolonigenes]|uniref:acyl-CoA dehydrogenase family protein n=1 Tax=Lentzea aerocolonigenes TaxID=68170 RepID=UPI0004C32E5C|nr:acyl-CoA dehydrogenase family protein [Lentzea aerocolonigenes]MCP2242236.1 acyl-CoA dehydrogenase [Lentzea aerocolonigenes]
MTYPRIDPALLVETPEQRELRSVARDFFTEHGGDQWKRMAGELGIQGLAIPEDYGGSGYTFAELAVVLEEAGRALCAVKLLPTVVLAVHTLLYSGNTEACARYLPGIADGTLTATVAFGGDVHVRDGTLHGTVDYVLDGADADLVLVSADGQIFACESVTRTSRRVLDETRPQALLEFRSSPATPVGSADVVPRVRDVGRAALAAEQVGGIGHALDATVSYVEQRRQFGRPIGSFQAVKHRLARLLVEYEAARSAAAYATACVATESAELPVAAAATAVCSSAYQLATAEYVQLHGGIGFTWEHPAHRYVRRARSSEVLFGTTQDRLTDLAAVLGIA